MLKLTKKSQHVLQDLLSLIKPIISAWVQLGSNGVCEKKVRKIFVQNQIGAILIPWI
jgi:hypothetical protein